MSVAAIELEYAYRECEQITRREAANFYYGIRLLTRSKRQAMCAAYAFARRVSGSRQSAAGTRLRARAASRYGGWDCQPIGSRDDRALARLRAVRHAARRA